MATGLKISSTPSSVGSLANLTAYAPKTSPSLTGAGGVRTAYLSSMNLVATMQGQRVTAQDQYVLSQLMPMMIRALVPYFGFLLAETAKIIHTPHIDTGDTFNSIQTSPTTYIVGGAAVDVFVTTPYSKFLEFGFVHHRSGEWIHNPFMIPAADAVIPAFVSAVEQVAMIAMGLRFLSGPAALSPANDMLASARGALYSYSKFAGDIQVLGFPGLSASRGMAIKGAKGIGNIQAVQSGTIASRLTRLTAGRFGGASIRSGSFGGTGNLLSGPSGRIYNRISGRAFGGALSGIR